MIRYYLWGAGEIGKRFITHVPADDVIGYIDTDPKKQGEIIHGKTVIDPEVFFEKYSDSYVVITTYQIESVKKQLESHGVNKFFCATDCPAEYLDFDERAEFFAHVKGMIENAGKSAIWGLTIYSLYFADWVRTYTNTTPEIIFDSDNEGLKREMTDRLALDMPEFAFVQMRETAHTYNIVYDARKNKYLAQNNASKIVEIRNAGETILAYQNKDLNRIKGIGAGKRCFIVGTAPSLTIEDLDVLHRNREVCFGVNRIFYSFDKTSWRPNFYAAGDSKFLREYKDELLKYSFEHIFLGDVNGMEDRDYFSAIYGDAYDWMHVYRDVYLDGDPKFSSDVSKIVYWGATIVYTCLQIAAYMGFSEIYILGVDCKYSKGSKNNYFFLESKADNMDHSEYMMRNAYCIAEKYSREHGFRIYNASRGGLLDVFERVNFDELFL